MWRVVVALSVLLASPLAAAQQEEANRSDLATVAERTGYERTGTSEDVWSFLRALDAKSERTHLSSLGRSNEGRDIPLLIVADPPVKTPEEARRSGRMVVLLFGNIHAGETCGKEALQMLARDLSLAEKGPVLEELIVAIVPNYNPDGNERMAPDNRPGQIGPAEMGIRNNAQDLDLNRDWVKMEAPETRALVRFCNEWDPAVILDTHTTNGSLHQYTITYQGPKHPAGDAEVIEYVRDTLLPAVDEAFESATDYKAFFYGNFADGHTRWTTYPAGPRYGVAYRGMRNRLSVISEAYAYAPFEDRVLATHAFARSLLDYAAEHRKEVEALVKAADRRTVEAGERRGQGDRVAVQVQAVAFPEKVEVLGFEEPDEPVAEEEQAGDDDQERGEEAAKTDGLRPKAYKVELINHFVPTRSVERPWAYLIPADHHAVVEHLQRHGIEVEEVREDVELDAEAWRLGPTRTINPRWQGGERTIIDDAASLPRTFNAQPGTHLVKTAQPLGTLAAYMLEPLASDGLAAWGFFGRDLAEGDTFPVRRLMEPAPVLTRSARPLAEKPIEPRSITYEALYESRERPDLDGSAARVIRWIDDEHYLMHKDGGVHRVRARTGRAEKLESPVGEVAGRLAELPSIDREAATSLARRHFGPAAGDGPIVFEHENDLYAAAGDGSGAVRLTATPEPEEVWSLSPDKAHVAFVRQNDLWVVDLATQTPRGLTSGGSDTLRRGKHSWLYFEELYGRNWRAYWWSPQGDRLAFLESDTGAVPAFIIVADTDRRQNAERERYAMPGDRNPHVRAYVVSVAGGSPREIDLDAYDEGEFLISGVGWTPDGRKVRLYVQDRVQTWLDFLLAPSGGGAPEKLFRETSGAWVSSPGDPAYLKDGSFLLQSERDGWTHLYHFRADGKLRRRITEGQWEVRSIQHIDEDAGEVVFTATIDSPIASNLYRVRLDGGEPVRLTREDGSHGVSMSPDGELFVDSWSGISQTPKVALRDRSGTLVRWIDTNPVYEHEHWRLGEVRHVGIPTSEGPTLEGILHLPPDFDERKTYPVWFLTYGGPHAPSVRDTYSGGRLWERMLAEMGIVVFRADPYPASGKGAQSAWTAYKQLGVRELSDIEQAIRWLIDGYDWVDASRIGMSGHSYGGFMTAYALANSELFSAGIAGAPVTDWRLYDSIYTERYMLTPQDNPEGYEKTSVVRAAKGVEGRLLIAHGVIDDNVHFQNASQLIEALQKAGKLFEMAIYPTSRHGIHPGQYRLVQVDFIRRTMLDGRAESEPEAPAESEADKLDNVAP